MRTATVASSLAAFSAADLTAPPEVRALAVRNIVDAIGCGLAAVGTDAGTHATVVATDAGGSEEATILGVARRAPAAAAALANGTRLHALDFDDTHEAGICHATAVIAPAVLSLGDHLGASGAEVVDAYIVGCEGATRIAAASAPDLYAAGFHPTSICGAFGAAMASARLRQLTPEQTTDALGVVGSLASGILEYLGDGSATKPLHAGWAAHAGVQAAALAAAGASGPARVIEGRFGLLNSHGGSTASAGQIVSGLGERWEMTAIAIKPYPACHFVHAAAWAAAQLVEQYAIGAEDVAAIDVRIATEGVPLVLEPIAAKRRPSSPYDAKFSIPFAVAHQMVHGSLGLTAFAEDRLEDEAVIDLAGRIGGGGWRRGEPPSRFAAALQLETRTGAEQTVTVPHPPGSIENPLSARQLQEKFRDNAALALPLEAVDLLHERLQDLDGEADLESAGIAPALRSASRSVGRHHSGG